MARQPAVAFARAGAKVVVAGRREAEGQDTVRLIRQIGAEGVFVRTDVSANEEVEALIR